MAKTLILDINELYRVVPETKVLEGQNFKDIRELLKNLIEKVEDSGDWEFIQYVNNKPSLFLIRPSSRSGTGSLSLKELKYMEDLLRSAREIEKSINLSVAATVPSYMAPVADEPVQSFKTEAMQETEKAVEELSTSISTVKLPWEE